MNYENGIWVFGYGSLIWNPGFEFAEQQLATLYGFRRAFCLWSIHYRGTEKAPGLVLGLDPSESECCEGVVFFVPAAAAPTVHAYLQERELVSYAYHERQERLTLADGRAVSALCYVVDPAHSQYAGGLDLQTQADVITRAAGSAGPNSAYLENTVQHLAALGIADKSMEELHEMVCLGANRPAVPDTI